jgi:hypothetical protein
MVLYYSEHAMNGSSKWQKVSRELRGGATQSPVPLNLARERSGGKIQVRCNGCPRYRTFMLLRLFFMRTVSRAWEELDAALGLPVKEPVRQKEWYRGGVTRRLFN